MQTRFSVLTLSIWLLGIFCTCETEKFGNSVIKFKCPLSQTPTTFSNFAKLAGKSKNKNKFWTVCLSPDFSCAKIRILHYGHIFACIPDYGTIQPVFFEEKNTTSNAVFIEYDRFLTLSKGCGFLKDEVVGRVKTTVEYRNFTFLTDLTCCKGDDCHGNRWKRIWTDHNLRSETENIYWRMSIILSGTFFSMIVMKFSLMAYQKLRERLVINALKTINPTLKQADDEDQLKRRSSITKIFRISRKQRRPPREDSSSEYTNSTQKLLKSNQKNKTKKNC